jgi:ABC-type bacteriocin/lantibiotic exporter with double-glycine peptidase domain
MRNGKHTARLLAAVRRLETIVAGDANHPLSDDPVVAALGIAAAALGRPLAQMASQPGADRPAARLQRLATSAGFLCRQIDVSGNWRDAGPGPLIAFSADNQSPVVLIRRGKSWRVVEPGAASRPYALDERAAARLGRIAYQISPALPARALKPIDVLFFGMLPVRHDLAGFAAATLLAGMLTALIPIATSFMVGTVVPAHDRVLMAEVAVALVTVIIANLMVRLASSVTEVRIHGKVASLLRAAVIDRVLSVVTTIGMPSAPILNAQVRAVDSWNRGSFGFIMQFTSGLLAGVPSLVFLLLTAPGVALAVLAVMAAAIVASVLIVRLSSAMLRRTASSNISWMTLAYDCLAQIDTVRSLGGERQMFRLFADTFGLQQRRQLDAGRITAFSTSIGAALEPALVAAVISIELVTDTKAHSLASIPVLMAAATVAATGGSLIRAIATLPQLAAVSGLIKPILAQAPAPRPGGHAPVSVLKGGIRMHGVAFRAAPGHALTLRDVTLEIEPGEHVGIVGPSGAGKTTLIDVMIGLRQPEAGLVAFDGLDINRLDAAALRRQIGIVGQNARLFSGSLRSNIALDEVYSDDDIWKALRHAGLEDEVRRMPLGLSTMIGDGASTLSGGQVQRVLLARAIVGNPPIMIFDEATSALDPHAQKIIIAELKQRRVTVISVAHRLETLIHCDRIHVLDHGRIAEQGSPAELTRAGGLFSVLVAAEAQAE